MYSYTPVHPNLSSNPALCPDPSRLCPLFSFSTALHSQQTGTHVSPALLTRQSSLGIQASHQHVGASADHPVPVVPLPRPPCQGFYQVTQPRHPREEVISLYPHQNGLWTRLWGHFLNCCHWAGGPGCVRTLGEQASLQRSTKHSASAHASRWSSCLGFPP